MVRPAFRNEISRSRLFSTSHEKSVFEKIAASGLKMIFVPVRSVAPLASAEGDKRFVLEWRESGGPAVAQPTRKGFGQTVIARSLQYSDTGGTEVEFAPEGVICRISLPLEDLQD